MNKLIPSPGWTMAVAVVVMFCVAMAKAPERCLIDFLLHFSVYVCLCVFQIGNFGTNE